MPKVKPYTRAEDPGLRQIRADLASMKVMAGYSSVAKIAEKAGINTRTLQKHIENISTMRIGELLAYMRVCGQNEITIRR